MIHIKLTDRLSRLKKEDSAPDALTFTYDGPYGFEDELHIQVQPHYFVNIDLDPHMKASIVYSPQVLLSTSYLPIGNAKPTILKPLGKIRFPFGYPT